MKKILDIIFSPKSTLVFLLLFAVGMAVATFIEEKFNIDTAKVMIYNAKWFEFTMLMLALNFIGNIKRHKLFRWQKAGSFIFHIAFVLLIVGAGITRYIGFEGSMHIREGQSSNILYDSETNLMVKTYNSDGEQVDIKAFRPSLRTKNKLKMRIKNDEKGTINIKLRSYIKNAAETIVENVEGGKNIIELAVFSGRSSESFLISEGERKQIGKSTIVFGEKTDEDDYSLSIKDGVVKLESKYDIVRSDMQNSMIDSLTSSSDFSLENDFVYMTGNLAFTFER